jgi:hypothetical protein
MLSSFNANAIGYADLGNHVLNQVGRVTSLSDQYSRVASHYLPTWGAGSGISPTGYAANIIYNNLFDDRYMNWDASSFVPPTIWNPFKPVFGLYNPRGWY